VPQVPVAGDTAFGKADQFDTLRRDLDASGALEGVDDLTAQALSILTSSRLAKALDLSDEPEHVRQRYGKGDPKNFGDGAPRNLEHFLMARRLVEGGVRFVQIYSGGMENQRSWDGRNDIQGNHSQFAGETDKPVAGLLADLAQRGMLDDTLVIWGGEFGRTPVSENGDGRDHNPYGFTMWVAGGGVKPGLAYGSTDEFGFQAVEKRVSVHDLHATLLHQLGINHEKLTYRYAGRDFRLTDVHGHIVKDILA